MKKIKDWLKNKLRQEIVDEFLHERLHNPKGVLIWEDEDDVWRVVIYKRK